MSTDEFDPDAALRRIREILHGAPGTSGRDAYGRFFSQTEAAELGRLVDALDAHMLAFNELPDSWRDHSDDAPYREEP